MEQFAHDGDDNLLGFLAVGDKPIGEGFEQWIEDAGVHGGHVEGAPQVDGADLGDRRADAPGDAALVVARRIPTHPAIRTARLAVWFEPTEHMHWLGLRSIVEVTSTRDTRGTNSVEKRDYLTCHKPMAEKLLGLVRGIGALRTAATGSWTSRSIYCGRTKPSTAEALSPPLENQ